MKITSLQMAALLVSSMSLCSPFQLSRSQWHTGSQRFKLAGQSSRLELTAQAVDFDETDNNPDIVMNVADELELTQSKLKVLEHVVKKMKKKSEESAVAWEKVLSKEKEKQVKVLGNYEAIQKKYQSVADERRQLEKKVETITSSYETSVERSTKKISDLTKREASYKRDLTSYETKVVQMEEKIAKMAEERKNLEAAWKSETSRHEHILEEQRSKEEELSAELDDVYAERDEIMTKLEELRQRRKIDVEAIERTKSSLAASETRLSELQEKYAALQKLYDATQEEMQDSRQTIAAMEENTRFLEEKIKSASKVVDTRLQEEVETLRNAILELRIHHNSQLKRQQRESESQLAKMREDHYKQVQQFRKTVMERNDSVEKIGLWQRVRKIFRRN